MNRGREKWHTYVFLVAAMAAALLARVVRAGVEFFAGIVEQGNGTGFGFGDERERVQSAKLSEGVD